MPLKENETVISVRMDKKLKSQVSSILSELEVNHSQIISLLYKQIALHNKIPFEISIPAKFKRKKIV